jgi:uncharacterized membrane protein
MGGWSKALKRAAKYIECAELDSTVRSWEDNMGEQPAPKTSTGLQENVAGLLCYVLGWVTGIIFLILEKDNKFVRFHAIQSIVVFGAYTVLSIIFGWIPIVGWVLNTVIGIAAFILWVILMVKAYQGNMYKLPVSGDIAAKQAEMAGKK